MPSTFRKRYNLKYSEWKRLKSPTNCAGVLHRRFIKNSQNHPLHINLIPRVRSDLNKVVKFIARGTQNIYWALLSLLNNQTLKTVSIKLVDGFLEKLSYSTYIKYCHKLIQPCNNGLRPEFPYFGCISMKNEWNSVVQLGFNKNLGKRLHSPSQCKFFVVSLGSMDLHMVPFHSINII